MAYSSNENLGGEPESSDDEDQIAPFATQPPPDEDHANNNNNNGDDTSSHMMQLGTQPTIEEVSSPTMSATSGNYQQHHVRFPSMPARAPLSRRTRLQSISKPTTTIQMDTLPTLETLIRDQLEYACHTVVAGTTTTHNDDDNNHLLTAVLPVFWTLLPTTSRNCGRVYSRLQLAALSMDMQHAATRTQRWTADDWANAEQQLLFVRAKLLRRNANVWMEQKDEGVVATTAHADADGYPMDEQLEQHDMMVHACREVLVLVRTQQLLAAFRAALQQEQQDSTVQEVLADFRGRFVEAYPEGVPEELQPLVVGDLYSPKKKRLARDWDTVKDRVLEHLERVVQEGDYSIENTIKMVRAFILCQFLALPLFYHQTRSLLLRWDESILDIPALVRLGYGDVPNPVIRNTRKAAGDDDDDVSSMGGEPEDYRSMSITEQDKADITQLQSVRRPDEEEDDEQDLLETQPPPEESEPDNNQSHFETQTTTSINEESKEQVIDDQAASIDRTEETDDDEGRKDSATKPTVVMVEDEDEPREVIATAPTRVASPSTLAQDNDDGSKSDSMSSPPRTRSPPVVDATGIVRPNFMDNFRALLEEGKRERLDSDSSAKENNKRRRTAHADDDSPKRELRKTGLFWKG